MKIQGWFIERFGAFRNYEVRDLPDGLTIFYGPNGAGKSTLLAFLRQMLFGSAHPDSRGDSSAGRVYCAGASGVYTITRTADHPTGLSVKRPGGAEGAETDLESLFGGSDGRLIGSLLTFDFHDLQGLPSLSSPAVRERLFPPGAGRGLISIQRALDAIQFRKSEIAQRAGGNLEQLPSVPGELQARIDRATRAAARLAQILQAQAQARLTLDLRARTISDLKADEARYGALIDLSPVWQELTQARRELETIEPIDEFPADPEERLQHALSARSAAQRSVEQLVDYERAPRPAVSAGLDDASNFRSGTTEGGLGTVVRQRVRLHELPATATEDLTAWQRRLKEAVDAVRDHERETEATTRALHELELARSEIATILGRREPPSTAFLDEEARLVQHVRTTLAGLDSAQGATKRLQDQIAERSGAIRTLETQVVPLPSKVFAHMAWCAAVVGIAAAVWRYVENDVPGLSLLVAFPLVSAAGAAVQRSRRTNALEEESSRRSQLAAAREELERTCQSLLHHQERAARRRFDISVDSVRLGLPPVPSDRQLQEREAEVEVQRRQRVDWDNAQAALAETSASLTKKEELRCQQTQALLALQAHERQTIQEWHRWKVQIGLNDNGNGSRGLGDGVPSEAELLENCRRLRTQIAEWEQNATEWNSRTRASFISVAEPEGIPTSGGSSIEQVGSYETESTRMGVMVAQQASEQSPALQAARRRLRHCEDALTQLFSQAGVSNEPAFRGRLATYRRRMALVETIRACETRSSERLRREPAAAAILRQLSEGQFDEWRRRAAQSAVELTNLEAARGDALRQLQQLDAEACAASAESADLPVLEAERSGLAADVLATTRAWRTLAIASSVLADARRHVERESQPPALRRASEVLSAVTFSRYERVGQSDDQRELRVFDAKNGWKTVDQLSRGTLEQLYFSLRLGLAEESAQHGPRLPLVIDDVLDHFDPKRSHAMARQVVELSRKHQLLVFTRRPEICEVLRTLNPTANVITMQEL